MKTFVWIRLGIAAAVVFWFGVTPARAGIVEPPPWCVIPAEVPEAFFFFLTEELEELLPIAEEEECAKITQGLVKACHKQVSGAASCWSDSYKSMGKAAKIGCTTIKAEEECDDFFANEVENAAAGIAESAAIGHAVCDDDFADAIFGDCLGLLKK